MTELDYETRGGKLINMGNIGIRRLGLKPGKAGIRKQCPLCERKDPVFINQVELCPECVRFVKERVDINKGYFKITGRAELFGGWCMIHQKTKFNISCVNVEMCQPCSKVIAGSVKQYQKKRVGIWDNINKHKADYFRY